jgi:hypothetical protein
MESNATTIQALYRGRKVRLELQQKSSDHAPQPSSPSPSFPIDGVQKDAIEPPLEAIVKEVPSPQSQSLAESESGSDFKNIPSNLPGQEQQTSSAPQWPTSTHDDFDELEDGDGWPQLSSPDDLAQRNWVLKNKKILLRTITWNMCANKPPPVEQVQKTLLPLNRCSRSLLLPTVTSRQVPSDRRWDRRVRKIYRQVSRESFQEELGVLSRGCCRPELCPASLPHPPGLLRLPFLPLTTTLV